MWSLYVYVHLSYAHKSSYHGNKLYLVHTIAFQALIVVKHDLDIYIYIFLFLSTAGLCNFLYFISDLDIFIKMVLNSTCFIALVHRTFIYIYLET